MENYTNKKILIMGLGLHGGGLSVANWLISRGAEVRITDLKSQKELEPSLNRLNSDKIKLTLGRHKKEDFLWADVVVQNPGVPKESLFLKLARKNGAKIENEATLFFRLVGREKIIGITGTRGKSTVTNLICQILRQKFPKTIIAGNIATTPMFEVANKAAKSKDPVVLELSSWHLENLGEERLSPKLAVLTNILPDHLNRYKDISEYAKAKENIYNFQYPQDFIILNLDNLVTKKMGDKVFSRRFWFSKKYFAKDNGCFVKNGLIIFRQNGKEKKVLKVSDIKLPGEHNLENVLAVVCAGMIMGVLPAKIAKAIKTAGGLPHRLELVREISQVKYINDSASTTPDATIAGLSTFGAELRMRNPHSAKAARGRQESRIILIAGGSDKNIPDKKFQELAIQIKKTCKAVVLFEGKGSDRIKLANSKLQIANGVKNMSEAVGIAKSFAKKGDIVLLSPGCASFGLFSHEFDRGDQFRKLVKSF